MSWSGGADSALRLAELACARLLHDLSGVAGTLAGTIELLDEGPASSEGLQLAAEAAATLNLRLRALRAAWVGDGEPLGAEELAEMAAALSFHPRVRGNLAGLPPAPLPGPLARVALCLLIAGAECLPRGGSVSLSGDADGVSARIDGPQGGWPDWLGADAGSGVALPDSSRAMAGPMLALAARSAGLVLRRAADPQVLAAGRE